MDFMRTMHFDNAKQCSTRLNTKSQAVVETEQKIIAQQNVKENDKSTYKGE